MYRKINTIKSLHFLAYDLIHLVLATRIARFKSIHDLLDMSSSKLSYDVLRREEQLL